jgi:hypothetical protein
MCSVDKNIVALLIIFIKKPLSGSFTVLAVYQTDIKSQAHARYGSVACDKKPHSVITPAVVMKTLNLTFFAHF